MTVSNPTLQARGFAWYVSPIGAGSDQAARPFDLGMPRAWESPLRVLAYWPVGAGPTGVRNVGSRPGFLVLTPLATPPEVGMGWAVEPARLDAGCIADGGNLRVIAVAEASAGSEEGGPRECVFEVFEEQDAPDGPAAVIRVPMFFRGKG